MKVLILLLVGFVSFGQDSLTPGTNPLANILPPPISKYENPSYSSEHLRVVEMSTSIGIDSNQSKLSQNVKDYQYEQENQQPLKEFEDDKIKFNDYTTPANVVSTSPIQETDEDGTTSNFGGIVLGLIGVFLTALMSTKSHQRRKK